MTVVLPSSPVHADGVRAAELPTLVRLGPNLYAACFTLMKLLPARIIVDSARRDGILEPGATIVESTSGTFGLGLAMVGALRGHPVVLVSDPVLDARLHRRLRSLGASVEIVDRPAPTGGFQQARLDRLAEVSARLPGAFVPRQYDNPDNPAAYAEVAKLLAASLGRVDTLVGTVGSGGSVCGTTRALRETSPGLRTVAVDTHGSVLFGHQDRPRLLRGLGNSIMPGNLDHSLIDEVHWVGAAEAFLATRRLYRRHALYQGPTSGAAYLVSKWIAARRPEATVVALFPDDGHRYQDTVYDDRWLAEHGALAETLPPGPREVTAAGELSDRWDRKAWARRPGPAGTTR